MNNIVIVEDKLKRGLSLAEQFNELSQTHRELDIRVAAVCYFQPDEAKAAREIEECGGHGLEVVPVSLWNFNDKLDGYMDSANEHAIVIMDFLLDNDGSNGIPIKRVNIKYARRADEEKHRRIWFYTATSTVMQATLCELVGKENVLEVKEVKADFLRLDLEETFLPALQQHSMAGV